MEKVFVNISSYTFLLVKIFSFFLNQILKCTSLFSSQDVSVVLFCVVVCYVVLFNLVLLCFILFCGHK